MKKFFQKLWSLIPNIDAHALTIDEALAKVADPLEVSVAEQKQDEARSKVPYTRDAPSPCKHNAFHSDCDNCWKEGHVRAVLVIYCMTEAMGHLKTSDVLSLASKLAEKMEELEDKDTREWGVALGAEANFDLAFKDKAPMPTHFHVLPGIYTMTNEMTYIPDLLEKVLGLSRSEGRRLIKQGAIKIDGNQLKAENVSNVRLNRAIIVVGKQGKAIMCHYGLQNSTGYAATSTEDINAMADAKDD